MSDKAAQSSRRGERTRMPHSWSIEDWPADVFPNKPSRGRYLCRAYRDQLLAAGALTRIGRDLVVLGAGYASWLVANTGRVCDFDIAPNRTTADGAMVE